MSLSDGQDWEEHSPKQKEEQKVPPEEAGLKKCTCGRYTHCPEDSVFCPEIQKAREYRDKIVRDHFQPPPNPSLNKEEGDNGMVEAISKDLRWAIRHPSYIEETVKDIVTKVKQFYIEKGEELASLKSQPSSDKQKISIGEILMRHNVTPLAELVDDLEDNQPSFTREDMLNSFCKGRILGDDISDDLCRVLIKQFDQWLDNYLKQPER